MIIIKRAIVLYPNFTNISIINGIRDLYDPLSSYIAPHITIVFPFDSDITINELKLHLDDVMKGLKKFPVVLKDFTGDFRDGYLYLNVKIGNDNIIELHDRLYTGILSPFLIRKMTYCPHLTAGVLNEQIDFDNAIDKLSNNHEKFVATVDRLYVINIDNTETCRIELTYTLE